MNVPADVARCLGYVKRTRSVAERADDHVAMVPELTDIEERLLALHQVALAVDGRCPTCGGALSDPDRSPAAARHCRACRVGWELTEYDQRVRTTARPWPASE